MADKKQYKGRRSYLNEYERTLSGEFVYIGDEYEWVGDRKKSLLSLWLLEGVAAVAALAVGCISETGMEGRFYVLLPYIASFLLNATIVYSLVRLTSAGERVKNYVYRATVPSMPGRSLASAICAGVSVVALAAVILLGKNAIQSGKIAFLILQAINLAFSLLMYKKSGNIKLAKVGKTTKNIEFQ